MKKKSLRIHARLCLPVGLAAGALSMLHLSSAGEDTPASAATGGSSSGGVQLKAGPFDIQPRANGELRYDDNIFFTTNNAISDAIWDFRPGVQAVAGDKLSLLAIKDAGGNPLDVTPDSLVTEPPDNWPGRFIIVDESPVFELFTKNTQNDYVGNVGRFNTVLPGTKSILGASFSYDDEPITVVQAYRYSGLRTISASVSAAYFISDKTSVDDAVSFEQQAYQLPLLTGFNEWKDTAWINYQWTPLFNVGTGLNGGVDSADDGINETFGQLLVRARYQFAEKLAFNASTGAELREYNQGIPQSLTPVFDIGCDYHVFERTSFNLAGSRNVDASIIGDYIYTVTSMNLTANQGITDRVGTSLAGSYGVYQSQAVTGTSSSSSDYYSIQLSLNVKITQKLAGQVFYSYRAFLSNLTGNAVDDTAGIQLTWKY